MALNTQTAMGNHQFEGPFTDTNYIPAVSGVYLITTLAPDQTYTVIDVGESENIRDRISNHDRSNQWQVNIQNGLYAWVYAADAAQRMIIERAHRLAYNPVCGDR